ncbi:MAG: protein-disulfide reductase DsbD [Steroidobacteraceae bacterium]
MTRTLRPIVATLALAFAAVLAALAPSARAEDFIPPEQAFRYSVEMRDGVVTVRWTVAKGYYLYRKRLGFESRAPWATLGEPRFPKGEPHTDEYFGTQEVYRGQFEVAVPVQVAGGATPAAMLPLTLKLQGCADAGLCYPPTKWNTEVRYAQGTAGAGGSAAGIDGVAAANDRIAGAAAAELLAAAEQRRDSGAGIASVLGKGDAAATTPTSDPLPAASPAGVKASGDDEFLPPDVAFRVTALADGPDRVRIEWQIAPGYYLYRSRLKFATDAAVAQLGTPQLPAGQKKTDEYFGEQEVYHDTLVATLPVSRNGASALQLPLSVGFQGCADAGLCYPPETRKLVVELPAGIGTAAVAGAPGGAAATGDAAGGFVSEQDRLANLIRSGNLALVLATFFGLGLLLAFTPCVLPMVPILSGIIAGHGDNVTTGRAFTLSLTYVLGMAFTNTLAGIAAAAAGQQIQAAFQQPWIIVLFGLLFVVLAISMFGAFTIQMPSVIQTRLTDVSNRQRAGSYGGVAVMGALSALIVTACVAPPLFATLAVIGQSGNMFRGGSALFAMSLGMGAPLLVIGTSAGKLLPRAGAWMDTVKKFFGVLMLGVAAWMFARIVPERWALLLWAVPAAIGAWLLWTEVRGRGAGALAFRAAGVLLGIWGLLLVAGAGLGGSDPLRPLPVMAGEQRGLEFRRVKSVEQLDAEVAAARAAGKAVMLDFYADWCVSCKEMEKYTFTEPAVIDALGDAVLLQADVTANDEADQALLKRFGIFGPPTIAFYGPDGAERSSYRVVGFMKAEEFARVAREATGARSVAAAELPAADVGG